MGLGALKDAFLNQHVNWQANGILFYLKDLSYNQRFCFAVS